MKQKVGLYVSLIALPVLVLVSLGFVLQLDRSIARATPKELVATYDSLADGILSIKKTEANMVRSILGTTMAHAQAALKRARRALREANSQAAQSAIEDLAAFAAHLGTEGDNAVAGIRKRLVEGGHHHNAEGERKGIFDEGFVIVTRAAKKSFLDASRAIGQLSRNPTAQALDAEWGKIEATWQDLMKKK